MFFFCCSICFIVFVYGITEKNKIKSQRILFVGGSCLRVQNNNNYKFVASFFFFLIKFVFKEIFVYNFILILFNVFNKYLKLL